jgi:hypothetical protein
MFQLTERDKVNHKIKTAHSLLPTLLKIGSELICADMSELQEVKRKIATSIPGISSRLSLCYSLCMFIASKVS